MHVQRQIDELLAHRASEWLDLLPTASEAECADFARWLGESRLHVEAFLDIAEIEFGLHRIDGAREHDVEALLERIAPNVVPLSRSAPQAAGASSSDADARQTKRRVWQTVGTLAACVAVTAIALFIYKARTPEFSTSVGEQKTVALADTSVITLNALSKIEVHLEDTERDIQLSQGEALFTVAHDAKRPFKVHTRAGTVQAVGTEFNVYDRPDGDTRVSVLEGRVLLTARGAPSSGEHSELLGAGEEADIRLDGTIQRKADAVVANTVAWRQRRLVFENAGLDEMVAEFNRYNRALRLRLEDIPASTYRYSGVFDAADPESFISLLAREPDLAIERRADEVIVRPRVER